MKIAGQNIDAIIIYKRKYNFELVAKKLTDLGYLVVMPENDCESLVYDQGLWKPQDQIATKDSISWEIFVSYDNADIETGNKPAPVNDDLINRIAKLFESNEFLVKARKLFPETEATENMMTDLCKQIHDLIKAK